MGAPEGTTTYAEEPVGDETEYDQVDMESTDSTPSSTTTAANNQTPGTAPNENTTGGEPNETTTNSGVNTEKSTSATPEDSTATDDSSVSRAALAIGAAAFTLFATLL